MPVRAAEGPQDTRWQNWGRLQTLPGRGCVLLAAPHGRLDSYTDDIAFGIARRSGFPAVVATGFIDRVTFRKKVRINVNRPTEGARRRAGREFRTPRASAVFRAFAGRVMKFLATAENALYVEIHGQARLPQKVDVATVGMDAADARALKRIWAAERAAMGEEGGLLGGVEVRVEPADEIRYKATASKRIGLLSRVRKALHIELPRRYRFERDRRGALVTLLARVLPKFYGTRRGECRVHR